MSPLIRSGLERWRRVDPTLGEMPENETSEYIFIHVEAGLNQQRVAYAYVSESCRDKDLYNSSMQKALFQDSPPQIDAPKVPIFLLGLCFACKVPLVSRKKVWNASLLVWLLLKVACCILLDVDFLLSVRE